MNKKLPVALSLLVFLVGATSNYDLTIIARVPLAEIIAFGSLPFLLRGVNFSQYRGRLNLVIFALLVWAFGVAFSDFLAGNRFDLFLRGLMKPIFSGLWALFIIGILVKDFRVLMFFPYGKVLGALQNYYAPQGWTEGYLNAGGYQALSYGLAPIIAVLATSLALLVYQKTKLLSIACLLSGGILLAGLGAPRSSSAIYLLSGLLLGYLWWTRDRGHKTIRLTPSKIITFGVMALIGMTVIFYAYIYTADAGLLGEQQRSKLVEQSNSIFGKSPAGLVLGGRPQFFGALLAIWDKPITGYGSWTAWMMTDYFYEASSIVGTDTSMMERLTKTGEVAGVGHSVVLVAWLENSIFALIGICLAAYCSVRVFLATLERENRLAPYIILTCVGFFWQFFFSPFNVSMRYLIGFMFALYVTDYPFFQAPRRMPRRR